jgi:serine/threonine protein kinase
MERVNPSHLNKDELCQQAPQSAEIKLNKYLIGIKRGIDHIHSLGLVHNDINPNNIMITRDDNAVIIDLDSCLSAGLPLGLTKRTFQWHDPNVQVSHSRNDDWAFREICTWLVGAGKISTSQE